MKSQTLNRITKKAAKNKIALSIGLSIALANAVNTLSANAQNSTEDSYLPPEVVPTSQSTNYGSTETPLKATANALSGNIPGILPQVNQQQNFQTPQEVRQAIYDSWANNKIFSQPNGQTSYNETSNPMINSANQSISNQNMPAVQNLGQPMPQDLNNQMNPATDNPAPAQTQMLSGNVNTQSTSQQRTSGGISHLAGVCSGLAMSAAALIGMRSAGGTYSAGLLGAGTANYGLNSGFRF